MPTPEARYRRATRTPVLVVAALAWVATIALHEPILQSGHGTSAAMSPTHSAMAHGTLTAESLPSSAFPAAALGWLLMVAAMMSPLLIPTLRHVQARSLPRRRRRAVLLVIAAYAAIWAPAGLALHAVAASLRWALPAGALTLAAVVLAAAVWQLSPLKQRCLNRHHAHRTIAAFGRDADLDALRAGGTHAFWCFGSCWAFMLVPLVAGAWHLPAMALVTLWIWAERFDTPAAPAWRARLPLQAVRIVTATTRSAARHAQEVTALPVPR